MRIPASVAHSLPAAIAPCTPRTGCFKGRSGSRLDCATLKAASAKKIKPLLSFMRLLGSSWLHYTQRGESVFDSDSDGARSRSLYNGLAVNENPQQEPSAESSSRSD